MTRAAGREIGVALLGLGNVGAGVIKLLEDNAPAITARLGARLVVRAIAVRAKAFEFRVIAVDPEPVEKPDCVERLNSEIRKIVNSAEVKDAWAKQGAAPLSMSTDEFGHYIREDIAKWTNIVRISGAKVD